MVDDEQEEEANRPRREDVAVDIERWRRTHDDATHNNQNDSNERKCVSGERMRKDRGAARRSSVETGSRVPDPARKPGLLEVRTNLNNNKARSPGQSSKPLEGHVVKGLVPLGRTDVPL